MWTAWLTKFSDILDIHAPVLTKRLRCKKSPWINSLVIHKLRERDSLKNVLIKILTIKFGPDIKKLTMKLISLLKRPSEITS
jgi:hypothetical protein